MSLYVCSDWIVDTETPVEEAEDLHVFPQSDLRLHVLNRSCWCKPELQVDDEEGCIYSHNSMDGREAYQRGERKLH